MPQPSPDDHARLCDLTQGEHMLLWAFRAHAFGAGGCDLIRRQFSDALGPLGIEALTALSVFVRELGLVGKRRITLADPGSYRLTRDEQSVLAVFAGLFLVGLCSLGAIVRHTLGREPVHVNLADAGPGVV